MVDATVTGLKNPIWLRVSVEPEAMCTFSYSSNGNEFTADIMRCTIVARSISMVRLASMAPSPMPKEIGRLMIMKMKNPANAIASVM